MSGASRTPSDASRQGPALVAAGAAACVRARSARRRPWGESLAPWRGAETKPVLLALGRLIQLHGEGVERRREPSGDPAAPPEVKHQGVERAGRVDRRAQR